MSETRERTPAERLLDAFVGDWRNSGSVQPGRFGPGGNISGETSFRWQLHKRWLCYDSRLQLPGMGAYQVQGGVTHDDNAGMYRAWAANNVGKLLVYEGCLEDKIRLVFDQVHPPSPQRARVIYTLPGDGRLLMSSETSADGLTFTPYFETTMTRIMRQQR